jgi:hypothetical protein
MFGRGEDEAVPAPRGRLGRQTKKIPQLGSLAFWRESSVCMARAWHHSQHLFEHDNLDITLHN